MNFFGIYPSEVERFLPVATSLLCISSRAFLGNSAFLLSVIFLPFGISCAMILLLFINVYIVALLPIGVNADKLITMHRDASERFVQAHSAAEYLH